MRYAVKSFREVSKNCIKNCIVVFIFFIFSTITKRYCCALNPCLKPHRNFYKKDSKYSLICWCIHLSYTSATTSHWNVYETSKNVNKFLDMSGMSFEFEIFLESNRLIAVDICSLPTFWRVKVEFNSAHLFLIASILGCSLYLITNSSRL